MDDENNVTLTGNVNLSEGLSSDTESTITTTNLNSEINLNNNSVFQARVFLEDEGNVYGAEIVIFGSRMDEPIEKILITDFSKFNEFVNSIDNIKANYIPYTEQDKENMETILDYLTEEDESEKEQKLSDYNYALSNDSYLKEIGNLQDILENDILEYITEDALNSHHTQKDVVINATYLGGKEASYFSREGHTHDNYLYTSHERVTGSNTKYGHVKVMDNLVTRTNNGEALSAKQGYELNNKINLLKQDISNSWKSYKVNKHLSYRVNELLHLVVCDYTYEDCKLLKADTGIHDLEIKGSIPKKYAPTYRVSMPVYRGDIVLMVNKNGSVKIHNLTKHDTWNINCQLFWYYE